MNHLVKTTSHAIIILRNQPLSRLINTLSSSDLLLAIHQ